MSEGRKGLLSEQPAVADALFQLESELACQSILDQAVYEIVAITALRRSRGEVSARRPNAESAGVNASIIAAILEEDWTDPAFTAEQKVAFQFALQYDAGHLITDPVMSAALETFGESGLILIGLICSHYGAMARLAVGFRLDRAG